MAEKTDSAIGKNLLIVESPAKAKTISRYLGKGFTVKASIGHIVDLPEKSLGVDIDKDFEPSYQILPTKRNVAREIKEAAKKAGTIYLAPDPDREGEAIAWHIANLIQKDNPNIKRVLINEITKQGVKQAIENAGKLNRDRFEAQQARRILDRLVGYQISPLLWSKIKKGLSAGRVQSVAVRLICEREREIENFKPEEYWTMEGIFQTHLPPEFSAKLVQIKGDKPKIQNRAQAEQIENTLRNLNWIVSKVEKKERQKKPPEPFITARLQQEAAKRFRFPAKKTMSIAQQLYEGVELGPEGRVGLITYMRTDSVRVSDQAIASARKKILELFGPEHLPETPNIYKSKKTAQEAHEAIRPTIIDYSPEKIQQYLSPDQQKLYRMIYERFLASQMKPAILDQTTIELKADGYLFRATGSVLKFPGFLALWKEEENEEGSEEKEEAKKLPEAKVGEKADLMKLVKKQHFTEPPPRYNEASLIKELEEKGIGRPSTYAQIVSTIQDRNYVKKDKGVFKPTELGFRVNDVLVLSFPEILNVQFTARMEEELDEVEEGKVKWVELLKRFYEKFSQALKQAPAVMDNVKSKESGKLSCPKCGKPLVVRFGKQGEFVGCSGFPDCDFSSNFKRNDQGEIELLSKKKSGLVCPICEKPLVILKSKYGEFLGCSGYPRCKFIADFERTETGEIKIKERKKTEPVPGASDKAEEKGKTALKRETGIVCPRCGKPLVIRQSQRGEFLGCSGYPRCRFTSNFTVSETGEIIMKQDAPPVKPTDLVCEKCGKPMVIKGSSKNEFLACSGYPDCKNIKNFRRNDKGEIEVVELTNGQKPTRHCPLCGKEMVYRRGRYGPFLACSGYPDCKFIQPIRKKKEPSEKQ